MESADWRKSTYSGPTGNQCVEAGTGTRAVLVRDTTNRDGAMLSIPAGAWQVFTSGLK